MAHCLLVVGRAQCAPVPDCLRDDRGDQVEPCQVTDRAQHPLEPIRDDPDADSFGGRRANHAHSRRGRCRCRRRAAAGECRCPRRRASWPRRPEAGAPRRPRRRIRRCRAGSTPAPKTSVGSPPSGASPSVRTQGRSRCRRRAGGARAADAAAPCLRRRPTTTRAVRPCCRRPTLRRSCERDRHRGGTFDNRPPAIRWKSPGRPKVARSIGRSPASARRSSRKTSLEAGSERSGPARTVPRVDAERELIPEVGGEPVGGREAAVQPRLDRLDVTDRRRFRVPMIRMPSRRPAGSPPGAR